MGIKNGNLHKEDHRTRRRHPKSNLDEFNPIMLRFTLGLFAVGIVVYTLFHLWERGLPNGWFR